MKRQQVHVEDIYLFAMGLPPPSGKLSQNALLELEHHDYYLHYRLLISDEPCGTTPNMHQ